MLNKVGPDTEANLLPWTLKYIDFFSLVQVIIYQF